MLIEPTPPTPLTLSPPRPSRQLESSREAMKGVASAHLSASELVGAGERSLLEEAPGLAEERAEHGARCVSSRAEASAAGRLVILVSRDTTELRGVEALAPALKVFGPGAVWAKEVVWPKGARLQTQTQAQREALAFSVFPTSSCLVFDRKGQSLVDAVWVNSVRPVPHPSFEVVAPSPVALVHNFYLEKLSVALRGMFKN